MQKNKPRYRPYIFHKSNWWWIIDENVKWKSIKLPEEEIKYLGDLWFGSEILDITPKYDQGNNSKLNHIKIKNFFSYNERECKQKPQTIENIGKTHAW